MLRKFLSFFLIILNSNILAMDLPPQELMMRGRMNFNNRNYVGAKASFERVFAATQEKSVLHVEAAKMLALIFLQDLGVSADYQKALTYAQQGYDISKSLLLQEPQNEALRGLYAQLASYIGRIYKDGPNKDYEKALEYFTDSYNASLNIPQLRAVNAYDLAELYDKIFGLDTEHEQTMKYLKEAMTLGIKYSPDVFNLAKSYLENLKFKKPVEIEFQNKIKKKIDLDGNDHCSGKPLTELLNIAKSNNVKFIIARALVQNKNNEIGSFFCTANSLIPWLWGPAAFSVFAKINDEEALILNAKRNTLLDGRPIIGVDFFEWDSSDNTFKFLCNDRELFEGFAGRRFRLFLVSQDFNNRTLQTLALISLSEMYYLGLGGNRDLQKAADYIDLALQNKQFLPPGAEKGARIGLARIQLDLGVENMAKNPDLAIKYFQRAAFQEDDITVKICALLYLEMRYRHEGKLKNALLCIEQILKIKEIPAFIRSYCLKEKRKIEKELHKQALTIKPKPIEQQSTQQIPMPISSQEKKEETKQKKLEETLLPTVMAEKSSIESPGEKESKLSVEKIETKKEEAVESEEAEAASIPSKIDIINNQVNAYKAESLLKHFNISLADYSKNPKHFAYLKNAKNTIERLESLNIKDETLKSKIEKAKNVLSNAIKKSGTKEILPTLSTVPNIRIIIDPFNEEENLPSEFQKTYEKLLNILTENPQASGAKPIKSLGNNTWRVHLGHDYRLFYIVTPHFIGILGIEKKGKSTYAKLNKKYMNRLKWFTEIAGMDIAQLNKKIDEEKKLGHEYAIKALTQLKSVTEKK